MDIKYNDGNNKTNKILNFLDVNVKIGTKNINKLANSIYSANAGIISEFIGDFSSGIITSLLEKL